MRGALTILLAFGLSGCGAAEGADRSRPTVYGASSLRDVLREVDADARFSFGGSGQLQRQIAQGAPADVLLSASPKEPAALAATGRCDPPVAFATNELVLVRPAVAGAGIDELDDLARGPRRRIAVGTADVPVGAYTREALSKLGRTAVLERNVVSSEPTVASIVTKVRLGSADAGFVYRSDLQAAGGALREVPLPRDGLPDIRYELCVVRRGGANRAGAERFVAAVRSARGRAVLRAAGFGLP